MHKHGRAEKQQSVLLRFIPVVFPHLTLITVSWKNMSLFKKTLGHLETMICYGEETALKLLAYAEKELKQSLSTTNLEDLSLFCKCIRNVKASQAKVGFQHQTIWQDQVFFSG